MAAVQCARATDAYLDAIDRRHLLDVAEHVEAAESYALLVLVEVELRTTGRGALRAARV